MSAFAEATARQSSRSSTTRAKTGGKGIRTPGLLIANETLYQLSYTPGQRSENITRWRFVSNRNNEFAASQRLIPTGEPSGLQTHIATMESVSSCTRMKS